MSARSRDRRDHTESEAIGREILRRIGRSRPYADADADEVEKRLRNMTYGATHSRISALRREGATAKDWSAA